LAFPEITARRATSIPTLLSAAIHAIAIASLPLMVTPDGQKYIVEALQLMGRAPAVNMPGWDAPGMPVVLAVLFSLLGVTPVAVLVMQHALGVSCVYLVARATREVAGPRIALAVGLIAAIEPWSLTWTSYVLTEPLAAALAIGALWLTLTASRRSIGGAAAVGAMCALGLLTRPAAVVLFPFFLAAWMIAHWRGGRRAAIAAALLLGLILPALAVRVTSPVRHRSGLVGGPGLVLFWGTGMFGMTSRDDVEPALQPIYDRTAGDASNPIMDDRQVRFLRETGSQDDPATARAVGAIALRSIRRQPAAYLKNVGYTSLWLANAGIENKPPMYDELSWLTSRMFIDGRGLGQDASNFQGARIAAPGMRAFALDYQGQGPLRPWLQWWAATAKRGFPHVPLIVATLIALITSVVRRRWVLACVLAAPVGYLAAHAVLLAAVTRYASTVMPLMYVGLGCWLSDMVSAWRARRAPTPGYSAPAETPAAAG
jgi:uncharacterized membrane protein YphA (DoxX/SURF4 family)